MCTNIFPGPGPTFFAKCLSPSFKKQVCSRSSDKIGPCRRFVCADLGQYVALFPDGCTHPCGGVSIEGRANFMSAICKERVPVYSMDQPWCNDKLLNQLPVHYRFTTNILFWAIASPQVSSAQMPPPSITCGSGFVRDLQLAGAFRFHGRNLLANRGTTWLCLGLQRRGFPASTAGVGLSQLRQRPWPIGRAVHFNLRDTDDSILETLMSLDSLTWAMYTQTKNSKKQQKQAHTVNRCQLKESPSCSGFDGMLQNDPCKLCARTFWESLQTFHSRMFQLRLLRQHHWHFWTLYKTFKARATRTHTHTPLEHIGTYYFMQATFVEHFIWWFHFVM